MMKKKNNVKSDNGITLITLVTTIVLLVIITFTLTANAYDNLKIAELTKLNNDIETLNDRIAVYYVEYGELPVMGSPHTKEEIQQDIEDLFENDGEEYYTIDLSKLSNLNLNYGKGYESFSRNRYIINTESHIVYYIQGITYKGIKYHTLDKYVPEVLDYRD